MSDVKADPVAVETALVLEAKDVSIGYGRIPVVKHLDLHVGTGEILAVLGANGSGKSTTLLGLSGVIAISDGEVRLSGAVVKSSLHRRARLGLAYIPEDRGVFRELTTTDNLRLGRGDPNTAFELIPELRALRNRKAGLLSGGEQQMLALARALATEPKLLICDELSLGLAPVMLDRIVDVLREASTRGVSMLIVEQHVHVALELADRAIVLRQGQVVMAGRSDELKGQLAEIEQHYLPS
jgi:branched-chain amino acid transport system ATP-binding protein